MHKTEFIEKYEFKIKFNNENIEYLNYVIDQLKPFDNKIVNCKIKKAADKINAATQRLEYWLNMNSNYWYFYSNNNSYKSINDNWVHVDSYITMISPLDIIEDKRLKYDKLKELLTNKISYLKERNAQYTLMLQNLDWTLNKLVKLNDEAKDIFSSIPYGVVDDLVDLKSLGEKWFIKIKG